MITLTDLEAIKVAAEAIRERERGQPGTTMTEAGRDAYRIIDQTERAIRWLTEMGLTQREQVGPFGRKEVHKGDRVRIRKGAVISTTHPRYDHQNPKIARRDYQVTVYSVHEGMIFPSWHRHKVASAAHDQKICWPGEGGYWCYLSTTDIEVL